MKTWKTITITALTTLALTIGGIFIYTNTQTSHDNVETVKNEKVVSSSSKTSTSTLNILCLVLYVCIICYGCGLHIVSLLLFYVVLHILHMHCAV